MYNCGKTKRKCPNHNQAIKKTGGASNIGNLGRLNMAGFNIDQKVGLEKTHVNRYC